MIYDVLSLQEEAWTILRLVFPLVLSVFYFIFFPYIKKKLEPEKIKPVTAVFTAFMIAICLTYFSVTNSKTELRELKSAYSNRLYESIKGVISVEASQEDLKDGLDKFTIGSKSFLRVLPQKQIPKYGCWSEFVEDLGYVDGKQVKMDFINFPMWVSPPRNMGKEKVDQICILRFEVID